MDWKTVTLAQLSALTERAKINERKRQNFNMHDKDSDPINRLLNTFEPGTYCRPHKHEVPDKREVFIILRGKLAVIFFNDEGEVIGKEILEYDGETRAVEIPPGMWHTAVSLASGTAVYEIKDGPYIQAIDKNFASWAPKEGDASCADYLRTLLIKIGEDVAVH